MQQNDSLADGYRLLPPADHSGAARVNHPLDPGPGSGLEDIVGANVVDRVERDLPVGLQLVVRAGTVAVGELAGTSIMRQRVTSARSRGSECVDGDRARSHMYDRIAALRR